MRNLVMKLIVPAGVAAFIAAMCAGPGVIIVPASLHLADWFLCPKGGTAVPHVLYNPYNPGEAVWNGDTTCVGKDGKSIPGREDLAFPAMCAMYFGPLFVLLSIGWLWGMRAVVGSGPSPRPATSTAPTMPIFVDPQTRQEARELLARGQRIEAIKRVRERTDMGLKQAKDYVDSLGTSPEEPSPEAAKPAPTTEPEGDEVETLRKLKQMMDEGLITIQEYEAKKAEILAQMR